MGSRSITGAADDVLSGVKPSFGKNHVSFGINQRITARATRRPNNKPIRNDICGIHRKKISALWRSLRPEILKLYKVLFIHEIICNTCGSE